MPKLNSSTLAIVLATLFISVMAMPHASLARDGITACTVAKKGHLWEYRISVNVPANTNCRVYIWQDTSEGGWDYCWNESTNFTAKKCTDLINNKSFKNWRTRAKCDGREFTKQCYP